MSDPAPDIGSLISAFAALQISEPETAYTRSQLFFALPRELRDRIYHYAWSGFNTTFYAEAPSPIIVRAHYTYNPMDHTSLGVPHWIHTSRIFRDEALDQLYREAEFVVHDTSVYNAGKKIGISSSFFSLGRIRNLTIHGISAIPYPRLWAAYAWHSVNPARREAMEKLGSLEIYLPHYLTTPLSQLACAANNIRCVTLVINWRPAHHHIMLEVKRGYFDIAAAFLCILPRNLLCLEVLSTCEYNLEYIWASTRPGIHEQYLDKDSFFRAQALFATECYNVAVRHLEDSKNVRWEARTGSKVWRLRGRKFRGTHIYQQYRASVPQWKWP
jgi:hypothetical protein